LSRPRRGKSRRKYDPPRHRPPRPPVIIIIEPRGDRIHVDVLDENGVRKIAEFTDPEAMEFIRDLLAYLRGDTP
jgi:hypothetical protein